MENQVEITKKLKTKKDKFDFFDSSFACMAFIVLLLVTKLFVRKFWTKDIQERLVDHSVFLYLTLYIVIAIAVEAVFFVAGLIAANNTKVKYFKATTFNKKPTKLMILFAVLISFVSIFAFSGLTNVFVISLQKFGYTTSLSNMAIPNFGVYLLYVIVVCAVPAVCEESLFRGVILQGFRGKGKHFAVLMSALIFMLMHGGPEQTVHQFILGVILGYVFIYSGSIWMTILIHFLNNFISVTMIYITSFLPKTAETAGGDAAEQLSSWGSLAMTLVFSLAFATLGAYIIYVCIKAIKTQNDKKYQKNKELMLSLTAKENLSKTEVQLLKQLVAEMKDYEDNEAINTKTADVKPDDESAAVQAEDAAKKEKESSLKIAGIILLSVSLIYLVTDWILALISGFGA
ncbi:MAG: CPBP family intramembrane metalloprotease [Clostridia bacterium]|nr:CPBP family intramembrane metalloprotease [Clostridia bacterium]